MDLSKADKACLWHPYTQPMLEEPPIPVKSAQGAVLTALDGRKIIDAVSSWWVNIHGHSNKEIAEAVYRQALELDQVIFAGFTHEPAVRLAESLLELTGIPGKVFFSDDGSTAVEAALKMAVQYYKNTGEKKIKLIALKDAYHGDTFGAMSVSSRGAFNLPFSDLLFEVSFIDPPAEDKAPGSLSQLEKIIAGQGSFVFIYEPLVQGAAGMNIYSARGLDELLKLCRDRGVITIADEVFTGFGRTGKLLASDYLSQKPDIYCFSKAITGGVLPLGATVAVDRIYEAFLAEKRDRMFLHGHSYTANPLACAAANKSLEILKREDTQKRISEIGESHRKFKRDLLNKPDALDPRSLGTIFALEMKGPADYLSNLRDKLYNFYLSEGVLLRPLGNTVYIVPPYCTSQEELEKVYSVIVSSFRLI